MYTFFYGFYHFILTNQLYVFHVNGFVGIKLSEHFSFFRNLLLRIHWSNNIYGKTIRLPWKIWQFRKKNGLKWQNMCQWRYITVEVSRHPLPFTNVWAAFVICICMQIKCHTVYCFRLGLLHQSLIILQIRILMPLFRHWGNTLGKCAFTILIKVKKKKKLGKNQGLLPLGAFQMWQNGMNLRFKRFKSWQNQCGSIVKVSSYPELRVFCISLESIPNATMLTLCTQCVLRTHNWTIAIQFAFVNCMFEQSQMQI